MNIVPIVSSNYDAMSSVKSVIPQLSLSDSDIMIPAVECSDMLDKLHDSNNCIPCIDTSSKFQTTNDIPLLIENNASKNVSLSDKLRLLIVKYKVSHNFCNSLLQILQSEGLDVPKDVRTLMKTPKNHEIFDVSGGSYVHFGIKNMLLPFLNKHNASIYYT